MDGNILPLDTLCTLWDGSGWGHVRQVQLGGLPLGRGQAPELEQVEGMELETCWGGLWLFL